MMDITTIIWNIAVTCAIVCLFSFFIAVYTLPKTIHEVFSILSKITGFFTVIFSATYLIMRVWM